MELIAEPAFEHIEHNAAAHRQHLTVEHALEPRDNNIELQRLCSHIEVVEFQVCSSKVYSKCFTKSQLSK